MSEKRKRTGKSGADYYVSDRPGHASGEHHHKKKGPWRVFKHKVKKTLSRHPWIIPAVIIAVVVILGTGFFLYNRYTSMNRSRVTAANQNNVGSGYRNIVYKGKEYRYNARITAILYVGVDSDGVMTVNDTYTHAPNADSISLVVMDELHKKMTIIALNRNTICKIHRYALEGQDRGEFVDQLCLAYAYGENGPVSARNLCNAVSGILYGIPINEYVITNRSSLPEIMKALGNVTVTVPNDDLTDLGFIKGEEAVITSQNVETFVRRRDITEDFSNVGRMERQKTFINAVMEEIVDLLRNSPNDVWRRIEAAEYCTQTNITRSRYLDLTKAVSNSAYSEQNYYVPEGKNVVGTRWDEFYPDEAKLLDKLVEIFYIEK